MMPPRLWQSSAGLSRLALLGALALLPSTHAIAIAPRDTINVMIVGDSISHGREGDYTWRYRIWQWFQDQNIGVNFVGPYTGTVPQAAPEPPAPPILYGSGSTTPGAPPLTTGGYAPDVESAFLSNNAHFALWGQQLAEDMNLIEGMVSQYSPDYLLVELGFNDIGWFVSDAEGTLSNMQTFIENARAANPNLKFAIANVPQRTFISGRNDLITSTDQYNSMLATSLPNWSTSESPIYLVDFRDNYSCEPVGGCPAGTDGLHPDAMGEYQIAKAFADTLFRAYELGTGTLAIPNTFPTRPCAVPTNIQAVPSVAGVTVTWDPVYGAYGYMVQNGIQGQTPSIWNNTSPRYDTTWTVAGLTWEYSVQAYCANEVSGWTDTVSATANPTVAPGPSNINVNATANGIDLTWDAVEGYDVFLYGVLFLDASVAGSFVSTYGFTGTSASLNDLPVGDSYILAIQTWETIDGVPWAGLPAAAAGAVVGGVPQPPQNLQVVTVDEGATVQMTWDASQYAYGYQVWTRNINNASDYLKPSPPSTTSTCWEVTYLFPGAWNYEFCIQAFNGNYDTVLFGCTVAPSDITTPPACPPTPTPPAPVTTPTVTWAPPSVTTASPYPSVTAFWIGQFGGEQECGDVQHNNDCNWAGTWTSDSATDINNEADFCSDIGIGSVFPAANGNTTDWCNITVAFPDFCNGHNMAMSNVGPGSSANMCGQNGGNPLGNTYALLYDLTVGPDYSVIVGNCDFDTDVQYNCANVQGSVIYNSNLLCALDLSNSASCSPI